jgi:hypothetical protein
MRRAPLQFFSALAGYRFGSHKFGGKSLPLSTLLLAALCMVLAAPAAHATSREYSSRDAILSVLKRSELSASLLQEVLAPQAQQASQLSLLQLRKLRVILSSLDQSQIVEIQQHLATLTEYSAPPAPPIEPQDFDVSPSYSSLEFHLAAQLSGIRTNAYLE